MGKHNHIRKSTALVLSLCLLLALLLSGCGTPSSAGKAAPAKDWDTTIDITEAFNDALEDALGDDSVKVKDFSIDVTVSINEDGKYELTVDEKRLERTVGDVIDDLMDGPRSNSGALASLPPAASIPPSAGDSRLVGNWVYSFDLTDMLYDEIESSVGDAIQYFYFSDFFLNINLSFSSGGTVRMSVDEDALEWSLNNLIDEIVDGIALYFEALAAEEGIDMTLEEYLASEGYTMDDLIDEMLAEAGLDMDDMMSSVSAINISGTYEADGSNLTLTSGTGSNTLPYTLSGNRLTLYSDTGGMLGDTLVFIKQ